jgi:hypothetical protein
MLVTIELYHFSYVLTFDNLLCSYDFSYDPWDNRGKYTTQSFVQKRGFQCHFIVKVMVQSIDIEILTYNM